MATKMEISIFIFCGILGMSISLPVESSDNLLNSPKSAQMFELRRDDPYKAYEIPSTPRPHFSSKRPYFFLSDRLGNVSIIDAISYDEVISYSLPELTDTNSVIVGDSFYNIITQNGSIYATDLVTIMEYPYDITWSLVGSFPGDSSRVRNNAVATDGPLIYFVTMFGNFYVYDTILRTVTKIGQVRSDYDSYVSLAFVDNILFIHKNMNFYSYDGSVLTGLTTPEARYHAAIFKKGNNVCRIGGNNTNVFPDPVECYNPKDRRWSTTSHINEARWYPAIAQLESKTYVFGGLAHFQPPNNVSDFWRDSIEVLNHETNVWSYIPTRLKVGQQYVQALSFYY